MAQYDITTGAQTVTGTGAVTGTLDISGTTYPGINSTTPFTVKLLVLGLTAGATAVIGLEDTVNSFSAVVTNAVKQVSGSVSGVAEVDFSWKSQEDLPFFRVGTSSAACRFNVYALTGTSPSLTLHGFLQA